MLSRSSGSRHRCVRLFERKIASKSTPKSPIENPPFPPSLPLLFSFVIRAFQRCVAGLKRTHLHGWPTSARWRFCSDFERFRRFASRLLSEISRKMEFFQKLLISREFVLCLLAVSMSTFSPGKSGKTTQKQANTKTQKQT